MELDVLILRDPRESTKKCSLTPLRGMEGVRFVEFRPGRRVDATGRILLHPEGEELGPEDALRVSGAPAGGPRASSAPGRPPGGLVLLDCAWRRVPRLRAALDGEPVARRLPPLATAYPRRSQVFEDPAQGLASIEALYAALALLGVPRAELLAEYRWADEFLALNPQLA